MANRVNVNITARDLTRGDLARVRAGFNRLGEDLNHAVGARTRTNFARLSQAVNQSRRQLDLLRGSIPDDEFFRLDDAMRNAQRRLQRGFANVGDRAFRRIQADLDDTIASFRRLDDAGQIRIRVDDSALRRADARLNAGLRRRDTFRIRPTIDPPDTNHLRRALTSPFRFIGRLLGGTLSDGIGQGLTAGLRGVSGPVAAVLVTVLVSALMYALSVAGAAIAGALVIALGGAVAGLGIFLAAQAEDVKKKWKDTLAELKPLFQDAARPMLPVIEHARRVLLDMARSWAPQFQVALDSMRGPLMSFTDSLAAGFDKLKARAGKDLIEAFDAFMIAFGPAWESFMAGLGDALGALARTVRDHSTEIAVGLRMVLGLITTIIDIINFFANAWVTMFDLAIKGVANLTGVIAGFADFLFGIFDSILEGMVTAFGGLPIIGEQVIAARQKFAQFREGTVSDLRQAEDAIRGMGQTIADANARNKLTADISVLEAKVKQAKKRLQETNDKKVQAKIKAEIGQLTEQLRIANGKLDAINGRTVHTWVVTHMEARKEGVHGTQLGRAHGGIIGAATGGVRSNMTLVGERGPELVNLPAGSRVRSNEDSRRMMALSSAGGGLSQPIELVVNLDGRVVARQLYDPLREETRKRGGDVQRQLGQRGR